VILFPSPAEEAAREARQAAARNEESRSDMGSRGDGRSDMGSRGGDTGSGFGSTDGGTMGGTGVIPPIRQLTSLEQQYMAKAQAERKRIFEEGTTQKCWGKEFKGDAAFLSTPKIVEYKDFEINKRYKQVVEVTNVSLTFNQFKMLPLADDVRDYFDIDFTPPGRMSAGVSMKFVVWFEPKIYKDIFSSIPILAKTGRIDFPLHCVTKKTILTVTSPSGGEKLLEGGKRLEDIAANSAAAKAKAGAKRKESDWVDPLLTPKAPKGEKKAGSDSPKKRLAGPGSDEKDDEKYDPTDELYYSELVIDFGKVIFGEWSDRVIKVHNAGALKTRWDLVRGILTM
jgi:hypothetical protein